LNPIVFEIILIIYS